MPEQEPDPEQTYRILEGVRRARAAWLAGRQTIHAKIEDENAKIIAEGEVPLTALRSPKSVVETGGGHFARWRDVYSATMRGERLPHILVTPGAEGVPVSDVIVEGHDDLEQLFGGA